MDRGTFPSQLIEDLIRAGAIESEAAIRPEQVQPASLDLTLSDEGWSVPGSMLPLEGERVRDLVVRYGRRRLESGAKILVRGQVYLLRLQQSVQMPPRVAGYANNKSSIGRIDLQTRLLCDSNPRYDKIPPNYTGELWLEIIPKSFDIVVRAGDSLNQIICYEERALLSADELDQLQERTPLLLSPDGRPIRNSDSGALLMTLDLDQPIVGYRAKKSFRPIDLARVGTHDPEEFFEAIARPKDGALFLSREAFYIFSTHERVRVPPSFAVEMLPYDTSAGEFRAHYAGFFDPGFGFGAEGEVLGTPAVLEVRPYEDDLIVRHRQPVCKMAYERLVEAPTKLYGVGVASHYAEQRGPRLSKFFLDQRAPSS